MSSVADWFETTPSTKAEGEKGTLELSDLKPKAEKHESKGKVKAETKKPDYSGNLNYAEGSDPDPMTEREPGQDG